MEEIPCGICDGRGRSILEPLCELARGSLVSVGHSVHVPKIWDISYTRLQTRNILCRKFIPHFPRNIPEYSKEWNVPAYSHSKYRKAR